MLTTNASKWITSYAIIIFLVNCLDAVAPESSASFFESAVIIAFSFHLEVGIQLAIRIGNGRKKYLIANVEYPILIEPRDKFR
jgi:hypothetical protein